MEETIRQALLQITRMHKKFVEDNDVVNRLFPDTGLSVKRIDLDEAISELQSQVPNAHVWYEPHHKRYVLVPKLDSEMVVKT